MTATNKDELNHIEISEMYSPAHAFSCEFRETF